MSTEIEALPETKVERAKRHFRENKKLYFVGIGGVIVGAVAAALLGKKYHAEMMDVVENSEFNDYKPLNLTQVYLPARGHPGNTVIDLDTGEGWASQEQAANDIGVSGANLSRFFAGKTAGETINGRRLKRLGMAVPAEFIPEAV